jgi:hypothetical protein
MPYIHIYLHYLLNISVETGSNIRGENVTFWVGNVIDVSNNGCRQQYKIINAKTHGGKL